MRKVIVSLGIFIFVLGLFITLPATSQAQVELKEGMTQGDFALWLVQAIGAQAKLPPAAGADDAIYFVTQLGAVPETGWQKDEEMTSQALADLLGDEESANLSWDELVEKVRNHIQEIFDERKLGTFRILGPTGSIPAV